MTRPANATFQRLGLKTAEEYLSELPMPVQSLLTLYCARPTHISDTGTITVYHVPSGRFLQLNSAHTIETWTRQLANPEKQEDALANPQLWARDAARILSKPLSIFQREFETDQVIDIREPARYGK